MEDVSKQVKKINALARQKINDRNKKEMEEIRRQTKQQQLF